MEKFDSITKASFEEAVDALLNAHSQNSNKGKLLKEWFANSFGTSATVSHIKEDKQTGNRVKEQFDHKLPIVVFVCADEINRNTLIKNVREKSYPELNTVLIMSSGIPHKYETLLSKDDDVFTMWAQANLGIIPEQLEALSDLAKQRESDFKNYLVNVVGNKQENLEGYLSHLDRSFVKTILRQYTGKPFVYETTDLDLLDLVLKKVRQSPEDQKGNRNSSSRISRYVKFLQGITDGMKKILLPHQKIVYGAPGTGKSFATDDKIKEIYPSKDEQKNNVFRTTFHPDSDYSTFVGAYKPTKNVGQKLVGKEELLIKCKEYATRPGYNNQNLTQFGYDFSLSLQKITKEDKTFAYAGFLTEAGVTDTSATSYVTAGMDLYSKTASKIANITYSFVPQTFTKAYIQAWKNFFTGDKKPVFLVIEEINRGNCAQIFGDLFQLLDRDDETGISCYPIKPDTDLGTFIADELSGLFDNASEWQSIVEGEELLLPSNLHVWATMNTSDQSLFPIDSAFKRRWKWEYVKIKNGVDKKTQQPLDWEIKFDHENGGCNHKWWDFIQQINKIIASMTSSADKQLGYFFCKPDKKEDDAEKNTIISEEAFVGKVVFYLWNDVFKNYAMDEGNLFKFKTKPDAKDEDLTFPDFYDEEGKVNGYVAAQFIEHVMAWEKDKED